ncbi:hypothetical protein [Streptomyces virginiae]|nr:hypothetical protein [Streptomyces virginiae]MCX4959781.1 hypothetical protein [Streptomyces virginiae]
MDVPLEPLTALKRYGEPAEAAAPAVLSAGGEAAAVRKVAIAVDGGGSL